LDEGVRRMVLIEERLKEYIRKLKEEFEQIPEIK
jgi:hypothetical protein